MYGASVFGAAFLVLKDFLAIGVLAINTIGMDWPVVCFDCSLCVGYSTVDTWSDSG